MDTLKTLVRIAAFLTLLPVFFLAQEFPDFLVTPSVAKVLLRSDKDFRAVNSGGRAANAVKWSISSSDAKLSPRGDLVTVTFTRPGTYTLTGYGLEGSGSATIEVIDEVTLPINTVKWSLDDLPGCKHRDTIPAVATSESAADIFVEEQCPFGTVIRAVTSEGLELWRTVRDRRTPVPVEPGIAAKNSLAGGSFCDQIKTGMTRDEVDALPAAKALKESERGQDVWRINEGESECKITFKDLKVTKKQKVIAN
jgi:hypothetical protein